MRVLCPLIQLLGKMKNGDNASQSASKNNKAGDDKLYCMQFHICIEFISHDEGRKFFPFLNGFAVIQCPPSSPECSAKSISHSGKAKGACGFASKHCKYLVKN